MTMLHLALSPEDLNYYLEDILKSKYVLASFYYFEKIDFNFQRQFKHFILDSGAFSFFNTKEIPTKDEIIAYCDRYANYINEYNVKHFAEIDVDKIYGYDFVLFLRKRLENKTGKKCMPIWHHSRGKEDFIKMCKEYSYAGVGGIASGEQLSKHKYSYKHLNRLARKYGCKLHGMGFTPTKDLYKYEFYSTDSTSWKSGTRFGTIYHFKNGRLFTIKKREKTRLKDYQSLDKHNIEEWLKYQEYCDKNKIIY